MSLVLDLISRRAFTPDPLNEACTLAERFARRPLMAVSLHRESLDASMVSFGSSGPTLKQFEHFEFAEEGSEIPFLSSYAERQRARECVVSLNYGFKVSVTTRALRPLPGPDEVQFMRYAPERIMGEALEMGQRPALAFHPSHDFAFVFTVPETELIKTATLFGKANLGVARIHVGACSFMRALMERHWEIVPPFAQVLLVSSSVVFQANLHDRRLEEPGYAAMRENEVLEEVTDRLAKLRPNARIILVNDSPHDIASLIAERSLGNEIVEPMKAQSRPLLYSCCLN